MAYKISKLHEEQETELGCHLPHLQIFQRCTEGHIHHKRNREPECYRKLNRQKSVFPSDTALLKALYLPTFEATKKWTMPLRNWGQVYRELSIMYEGRLPEYLYHVLLIHNCFLLVFYLYIS